nr:hypothetical protein [Tanacetum cinerariifolium]
MQIDYWLDPKHAARAAQNGQNQAKNKVFCSLAILRDQQMESSVTRRDQVQYEEMLRDLGANAPTGVPYTEEQIMAMVIKGKQRGHIPEVGRVLAGQGRDTIFIGKPRGGYSVSSAEFIALCGVAVAAVNMVVMMVVLVWRGRRRLGDVDDGEVVGVVGVVFGGVDDEDGGVVWWIRE